MFYEMDQFTDILIPCDAGSSPIFSRTQSKKNHNEVIYLCTFDSHSKKTCFFCQEVHGRRSLKIRIPFSMQKSLMSLFDRQILTRIVTVKIHNAKDLRRRYPLFQVSSSVKKFKLVFKEFTFTEVVLSTLFWNKYGLNLLICQIKGLISLWS